MKRIVVLISGNGSNLQSIVDRFSNSEYAQVVAVFSNKREAYGLTRASNAGIDGHCVDASQFEDRAAFDKQLMVEIDQYQPDLIVLAGYMRILSDDFVEHYLGKMLNIHPSLLPKYPGLHTHQRAIDAGESEHGTSVHFVTPELDGGPVILQAKVPIFDTDSAESLADKVQSQEHRIYPLVVDWFVRERLNMVNGDAVLDGVKLPAMGYASE
ncbi:phosphoribosylglycinamide formyltransferase [Vibrio sp. qd031]|uniref:phosphoribosylglycinamide formyltransferase n=1 Tax=Vibrio sp. qd031 TaxID=1603038 RepID=UPI000A1153C7|nr:phosphoribosylglycinamide formyltransferase [Vibrio sp. qd031]ORT50449.1 phosphoribosylglycinamide formyltransferase [Vibrio sp. qd031]